MGSFPTIKGFSYEEELVFESSGKVFALLHPFVAPAAHILNALVPPSLSFLTATGPGGRPRRTGRPEAPRCTRNQASSASKLMAAWRA